MSKARMTVRYRDGEEQEFLVVAASEAFRQGVECAGNVEYFLARTLDGGVVYLRADNVASILVEDLPEEP